MGRSYVRDRRGRFASTGGGRSGAGSYLGRGSGTATRNRMGQSRRSLRRGVGEDFAATNSDERRTLLRSSSFSVKHAGRQQDIYAAGRSAKPYNPPGGFMKSPSHAAMKPPQSGKASATAPRSISKPRPSSVLKDYTGSIMTMRRETPTQAVNMQTKIQNGMSMLRKRGGTYHSEGQIKVGIISRTVKKRRALYGR